MVEVKEESSYRNRNSGSVRISDKKNLVKTTKSFRRITAVFEKRTRTDFRDICGEADVNRDTVTDWAAKIPLTERYRLKN